MNKNLLVTVLLILFTSVSINAQTSQRGFSFQGYAISPEGVALGTEGITTRFTVYPKAGAGFIYEEVQDLTTDAYGVFHAVVGNENPTLFQKMNFTAKGVDYWMKVEVKKTAGGVYTTISDAAMLAVPYARYAENGVPVGTIISFAGSLNKIPEGWLICDGTQLDGTSPLYFQLYNMLENTWGGSGTDFNLPDLQGRFLRGWDNGAGNDPDAADRTNLAGDIIGDLIGSYQTDILGGHNHTGATTTNGNHSHAMDVGLWHRSFMGEDGNAKTAYTLNNGMYTDAAGNHSHTIPNDGGNETRPKNASVIYIIKY